MAFVVSSGVVFNGFLAFAVFCGWALSSLARKMAAQIVSAIVIVMIIFQLGVSCLGLFMVVLFGA